MASARSSAVGPAAAAAALLALAVYANSLGNGLVFDDNSVIANNQAVAAVSDWRRILLTPSWFAEGEPTIAYRPLTTWTFALNHALHGERPLGYHLVNVLGHAGVSALLVRLGATLGLPAFTAGLAGAFFAVHPIHTEVVANGVGRAEILAAALGLLALLAGRAAATGRRPLVFSAVAASAYAAALLAKEHAVALLVLLPLADLIFADGGSPRLFLRRLRGPRALCYLTLVALTAGYLALRAAALGGVIGGGGPIRFWQNPLASLPVATRVLSALKVQALALWLLFVPLDLSADYSYNHIPVVSALAEPGALVGLLVAVLLAGLALVLWRHGQAFFWFALALVTYGVVSNLLVPIGTIFGERLLYLPSAGFCALLAIALTSAAGGWRKTAASLLAAGLLVGWGIRTGFRNPVWYDDLTLAEATVAGAPDSAHAHSYLGSTYALLGRNREALGAFSRSLTIDPDHVDALFNAGVIRLLDRQSDEALRLLGRVVVLEPGYFPAWVNRAAIHNERGDFTAGLESAERAVALRPQIPNGHVMRGFALRGLGRLPEARASFERALRLPNAQPDALFGLGATALDQGEVALAVNVFERLVQAAPSRDTYRALVEAYRRAARDADAARAAAVARTRFPDDPAFAP